jgi:steroid 5-alpha reductase family enzyme
LPDIDVYASGLAAALGIAIGGWLVSLRHGDPGIAVPLWPTSILLMTAVYMLSAPAPGERAYVVVFLVGTWAARLATFLLRRARSTPADRRALPSALTRHAPCMAPNRENAGVTSGFPPPPPSPASGAAEDDGRARHTFWAAPGRLSAGDTLYVVFGQQAVLAWIASLPLSASILSQAPLGWLDYAAVVLWLIGFFFETVGDQQLADFRENPRNADRVLDRGLWRYSRHPNYFGELCIWWSFWLAALAAGAWWTLAAPLLVTYLLVRVCGIPPAEEAIEQHRPGYGAYAARTGALLPRPPREC